LASASAEWLLAPNLQSVSQTRDMLVRATAVNRNRKLSYTKLNSICVENHDSGVSEILLATTGVFANKQAKNLINVVGQPKQFILPHSIE